VFSGVRLRLRDEARRWLRPLIWSAIAVLVAAIAVAELADHTQDRPDEPVNAAASTVVIEAQVPLPT
jgi:hypothetical protein